MSKTTSFPKILHIGDKQILDLFDGPVEITEKLDGSQLGFGRIDGELFVRSKGQELDLEDPNKMFKKAVEYVKTIADKIPDNYTFYGEYLEKPKHNTLAYERIPKNHIALFGVYDSKERQFHDYEAIKKYADLFDVDAIPVFILDKPTPEAILTLVKDKVSYLGGQHIEGVVVKAYKPWMFLGQIPLSVMSGKYVTEAFKEVHQQNWRKEHTGKGKLEVLLSNYNSQARWNKAIHYYRDVGLLMGNPTDIGPILGQIRKDLHEEEKENFKEQLWKIYKEAFYATGTRGFPQYYKELLVKGELYNNNDVEEKTDGEISE